MWSLWVLLFVWLAGLWSVAGRGWLVPGVENSPERSDKVGFEMKRRPSDNLTLDSELEQRE